MSSTNVKKSSSSVLDDFNSQDIPIFLRSKYSLFLNFVFAPLLRSTSTFHVDLYDYSILWLCSNCRYDRRICREFSSSLSINAFNLCSVSRRLLKVMDELESLNLVLANGAFEVELSLFGVRKALENNIVPKVTENRTSHDHIAPLITNYQR